MDAGRLIWDDPGDGVWNMAVDQALLESAEHRQQITLRLYRWAEPTLSIGYFQSHLARQEHAPSAGCPLVRRRTGGGAIVHHHELTYSLAIPAANRWSLESNALYDQVHRALIEVLAAAGLEACLFSESGQVPPDPPESFLCFQRRSAGDVVSGQHKLIGSAQRRLRQSLLQHGSILLARSPAAPELPGVMDLVDWQPAWDQLAPALSRAIGDTLQIRLEPDKLCPLEREAAEFAASTWFGHPAWTRKR